MGLECLNGRLRRCHIPPSLSQQLEFQQQRSTVSLLPFTLPNSMITTFELSSSSSTTTTTTTTTSSSSSSNNTANYNAMNMNTGPCQYNAMSFMLHEIKEIIHAKSEGAIIIDHCWSIIQQQQQHEQQHEKQQHYDGDEHVLVLAIAEKMIKNHSNHGFCTVSIYSRPMYIFNHDENNDNNENKDNNDNNENNDNNDNNDHSQTTTTTSSQPSSSFTHLYTFNLHHFVTCMTMDDHILIIGSYTGAIIYDIHDILHQSSSLSPLLSSLSTMNHDHNDTTDDGIITSISYIHIMKSCAVQALSISYPYFVIASGDRIGVWYVHQFQTYFQYYKHQQKKKTKKMEKKMESHYNKIEEEEEEEEEEESNNYYNYNSNLLAAIWSTKVDINFTTRITSLEILLINNYNDQQQQQQEQQQEHKLEKQSLPNNDNYDDCYIALSCWDGSAFVYHRHISNRNTNNKNQAKDSDNIKEEWIRIDPRDSKNSGYHDDKNNNNDDDDNKSNNNNNKESTIVQTISWEDPIIESDVIFPTFVTLFSIQQQQQQQQHYHHRDNSDNDNNNNKVAKPFMAVSRPDHSIIRCYDLELKTWVQDIGLMDHGSHSSDNSTFSIDFDYLNIAKTDSNYNNLIHQVHGLVCIPVQHNNVGRYDDGFVNNKIHLVWVDENDTIHEYVWNKENKLSIVEEENMTINTSNENNKASTHNDDPTAFWLAWNERKTGCIHESACSCFEGMGSVM